MTVRYKTKAYRESGAAPARVPIASSRASVTSADELVFSGEASEIRDLKKVLAELDRVPGEVVVRGWVYEVSNINSRNSAFSIVASLFGGIPGWGGKLSLSNGSTDADPTALRFSSSMLDVAISALDADSRFKQISDPHVRVSQPRIPFRPTCSRAIELSDSKLVLVRRI
ncbi:hypothetical protein [Burkholderia sp. BDU5]|uniref:hypothetical protein n=1 Tax=Burkholderia sp. BDU5 TaxID=1385590 RepID=UPI0018D2485D|nr:hypothetical protein [Burkholderia sp. BDU5]